ncbi:4Fe-4S dicluster domain-containing protein [Aestuariibacter halophilus]|uniref:4Fe-4S dicluster domain-containing protein n=1 Tax=Fluctibacter halophilus TaxID=226011 RepID=A0ABS8G4U0_9ALTE|nr:4Fe-4S dicluster domain-containing protein [Aestuariibacter halophilus]MCC2615587.1 4Fe-4S dicluster domain-containing protein [Aestuariibacter halophilus]
MDKVYLPRGSLGELYQALVDEGYEVIGPQEQQDAIVFAPLSGIEQLPWGRQEFTAPGQYRLDNASEQRAFHWNTGPQSFKPWLFKPQQVMWLGQETDDGIVFKAPVSDAKPRAFIGVRSCDIAALYLQDQHFMHGPHPDPWYSEQRRQLCIVAVNCSRAADTCFCVSTGDGPEATYGYDLLLDELDDGYLVQAKGERGNRILATLPTQGATPLQQRHAEEQLARAARQSRQMPDADTLKSLVEHLSDEQWLRIAERCLACGNCTSVCPTCFCSKQEAEQDLVSGEHQQVRVWDSCFSEQHGHIAGKNIRGEVSQRYRQWVLHKLATWQDQYQRSGCVGCGRCISWCPAAIDLVEEVNLMLGSRHD